MMMAVFQNRAGSVRNKTTIIYTVKKDVWLRAVIVVSQIFVLFFCFNHLSSLLKTMDSMIKSICTTWRDCTIRLLW